MMYRLPRQLHNALHQLKQGVCHSLVCAAALLTAATAGYALQGGATADDLAQPPLGHIASPTYLEKSATTDPTAQQSTPGWQLGGLNTQFSSNLGRNVLNMSGGLFFSRAVLADKANGNDSAPAAMGFGETSAANAMGWQGYGGRLLTGNATNVGKFDQVLIQRIELRGNGLSLSGGYGSVDKEFQGITDLTKQMNSNDAGLLKLGMTQTSYAANYTGIHGLKLFASQDTAENNLVNQQESGLTRTKRTQGLALALGAKHNFEYSVAQTLDEWDAKVAKRDATANRVETMKLGGALGRQSQFSLGQTSTTADTGDKRTKAIAQRDLSLKWNDWHNLLFSGGYTTVRNELTTEESDALNLDMKATLSSRLQLTGKLVDKNIMKPGAQQAVEDDLLDLRLVSPLAKNLQLTGGYKHTETSAQGDTYSHEQQVAWSFTHNWKLTSHLVNSDNDKTGDASMMEHQISGQIGAAARPGQLAFFTRNENLPNDVEQVRNEVSYTRQLTAGGTPARMVLQTGAYQLAKGSAEEQQELLAVQLINLPMGKRTAVSLGYYAGPKLGAGYLNYRTWGPRNTLNLQAWTEQDFTPYQELGGEVSHQLSPSTRLNVKQMQGEIDGAGTQSLVSYGIEQRIGRALVQGSKLYSETPGKTADTSTPHDAFLWKCTLPGKTPLPAWVTASLNAAIFEDSASWGFQKTPAWINTRPSSGLDLEKRETSAGGKTADFYALRATGMLSSQLFLHVGYEQNPLKPGSQTESVPGMRQFLHLAYALKPQAQLFGRYTLEKDQAQALRQQTISLGLAGTLSAHDRVQLLIDVQQRALKDASINGNTYRLEYERKVSADDSLVVKMQLQPKDFVAEKDRARVEASYRRTF